MAYVDDVDFISMIKHKDDNEMSGILKKYKLLVNNDKTEYTTINRKKAKNDEEWRKVKKVGSLLGDEEDIDRRKQIANVSMNKINSIYLRKDKVKLKKKMKIFRALVKSVLLWNMGRELWNMGREFKHSRQIRCISQKAFEKSLGNKISNMHIK
eukprot:gene1765-1967_t